LNTNQKKKKKKKKPRGEKGTLIGAQDAGGRTPARGAGHEKQGGGKMQLGEKKKKKKNMTYKGVTCCKRRQLELRGEGKNNLKG